jgi:hypothetical protein
MFTIDMRFRLTIWSMHDNAPGNPDPPSPAYLAEDWFFRRRYVQSVKDFLIKKSGKVPSRLQESLDEIKKILADSSHYPLIPGTPWAEIVAILAKGGLVVHGENSANSD